MSIERAHRQPWMAVLSALAHGNSPGGVSIALAAIDAVSSFPDEHAMFCFDRIRESLDEAAGRALENEMHYGRYVFKSEFARRYFGAGIERGRKEGHKEGLREGHERGLQRGLREGLHEGQLQAMRTALLQVAEQRFGLAGNTIRRPIEACGDLRRLTALVAEVSAAPDRKTVRRLVAGLAGKPARTARHRARTARTARPGRATRRATRRARTTRTDRTTRTARTGNAGRARAGRPTARAARATRTARATRAARATRTARAARAPRARVAR